jgi:DNA polymerase-3 subunit delta'
MGLRNVINQEDAKKFLKSLIASDRISHGYLFHGPRGVGKATLALAFAQALNCEQNDPEGCGECSSCKRIARFVHPDVTFVFPTSSKNDTEEIASTLKVRSSDPLFVHSFPGTASIKIKTIQALRMDLAMGVREGKRRVVILAYAERMTPDASNCLLRTLEEPTARVTFVLTATSRNLILPTILSRCQAIHLKPLDSEHIVRVLVEQKGMEKREAIMLARLSGGSLVAALEFAEQDIVKYRKENLEYLRVLEGGDPHYILGVAEKLAQGSDRNRVRMFVALSLTWLRDVLLVKSGGREADIANIDMLATLKKEAGTTETVELRRKTDILEEIIESMEQNVDLALLLSASFLRLAGLVKDGELPLWARRSTGARVS